jgi:hypothetical protein
LDIRAKTCVAIVAKEIVSGLFISKNSLGKESRAAPTNFSNSSRDMIALF